MNRNEARQWVQDYRRKRREEWKVDIRWNDEELDLVMQLPKSLVSLVLRGKVRAARDRQKRRSLRIVSKARKNFLHGKNPMFAWQAIGFCVRHNLLLPHWLRLYLAGTASKFIKGPNSKQTSGGSLGMVKWAASCCGFFDPNSSRSNYTRYQNQRRNEQLCLDYAACVLNGESDETASDTLGVSLSTLKRQRNSYFKKPRGITYRKWFELASSDDIPQEMDEVWVDLLLAKGRYARLKAKTAKKFTNPSAK